MNMSKQEQTPTDNVAQPGVPEILVDRLGELAKRVEQIEIEQRQPVDDDSEERATERENDESVDAIKRAALTEIDEINHALGRWHAGTYGRCLSCGEPIDPRRLQLMPAAATCMTCATAVGS
jgi:DnaK suppressor protein